MESSSRTVQDGGADRQSKYVVSVPPAHVFLYSTKQEQFVYINPGVGKSVDQTFMSWGVSRGDDGYPQVLDVISHALESLLSEIL